MRTKLALVAGILSLFLVLAPVASAQGNPEPQVPSGDIVPRPNSGQAPTEAGDRGGALQLLIPALILVAVGGGVWHLSRQARAARTERSASGSGDDPGS